MDGGEACNREADMDVGGQPTDNNPAATARFSNSHGRKTWMAAVQDGDPTPRGGDDPIGRRREGGSQPGQRCVADVDTRTPAAKAETIKD